MQQHKTCPLERKYVLQYDITQGCEYSAYQQFFIFFPPFKNVHFFNLFNTQSLKSLSFQVKTHYCFVLVVLFVNLKFQLIINHLNSSLHLQKLHVPLCCSHNIQFKIKLFHFKNFLLSLLLSIMLQICYSTQAY